MTPEDILEQASRLVNCDGDPCDFGCAEKDLPRAIALGKELYPGRPYRVARNWCWADLDVDEQDAKYLDEEGVLPAFLFAGEVIEDERNPEGAVIAVKTSLLVEFRNNCLFTTRNTIYILLGTGSRLVVSPIVFHSLFF